MSELVRCTNCRGAKVALGIGGISKKCEPCKGIGFIEVEAKKPTKTADHAPDLNDTGTSNDNSPAKPDKPKKPKKPKTSKPKAKK